MTQCAFFLVLSLACWSSQAFVVEPWLDAKHGCNNPAYWCKSEETAKECGVVEYCKIGWVKATPVKSIQNVETEKPMEEIKRNKPLNAAQPIKVTLYYESLCPDCKQFILYQLYPTYQALASSGILELKLVPYGNAREYKYGSQWVFYCQHGTAECTGNVIETCGIHVAKNNMSLVMPFVHCLEQYGPTMSYLSYCAGIAKLDATQIDSCARGSLGNSLEHQMAVETDALNPPHQYVPWITVDGVHTNQIQNAVQTNMLSYVCSAYQGVKPPACSGIKQKRANVCYRD